MEPVRTYIPPPIPSGVPSPTPISSADEPPAEHGDTIDQAVGASAVQLSFWQSPFAQKIMPFLSSVFLHAGILIIGLIFFTTMQAVRSPGKTQLIVPDAAMANGAAGGALHSGIGQDASRDAAQNLVPNVDTNGTAKQRNSDLAKTLESPGSVTEGASVNPLSSINNSRMAAGEGGDPGPAGPFGIPGGGSGLDTAASFLGVGGNGHRIIFIIDATGSMLGKLDSVNRRVSEAIDILRAPQSFDVIFFNEYNAEPMSPKMLFVNPANQLAAKNYIAQVVTHGRTDPLPALKKAFELNPDLIYFLIDPSDFPDKQAVIDLVHAHAVEGGFTMNIIAYDGHNADNEEFLKKLAQETHGTFTFKTVQEVQQAK